MLRLHRETKSYNIGPPASSFDSNTWTTKDLLQSDHFVSFSHRNVLCNAIKYLLPSTLELDGGGTCIYLESFSTKATVPSASGFAGHWYTLGIEPLPSKGNFWKTVNREFLA